MPHSLSPRERSPGPPSGSSRRKERTSLLVRNLPRSMRQEELRYAFTRFGPMRDAYIPRDYYTGESRGFGFVEFDDPRDASDAQYDMDRSVLAGREITVVFAEERRKAPDEMRTRERTSRPPPRDSREPRDPDRRRRSYSPRRRDSPPRRDVSPPPRDQSPPRARDERERNRSPTRSPPPKRTPSPRTGSRSPSR
ncbi:RRM superfamily protein [Klebsormidium nitens]|uniref:RRM superfamily protein n=1 Tax=Klebsormidium nitens TaxID=105231 RepID=A0A1Y1ICM0_KLENI|nr:RRM superfamily protein [Klebsormidium nitens]|eukprot:GAQ87189.1 RRM superfamily protein [Klebsormidium nitens]